jgi:hypothetical protein
MHVERIDLASPGTGEKRIPLASSCLNKKQGCSMASCLLTDTVVDVEVTVMCP